MESKIETNRRTSGNNLPAGYVNIGPTNIIKEAEESDSGNEILLVINGITVWISKSLIRITAAPAYSENHGYYWVPQIIANRNSLPEYKEPPIRMNRY